MDLTTRKPADLSAEQSRYNRKMQGIQIVKTGGPEVMVLR